MQRMKRLHCLNMDSANHVIIEPKIADQQLAHQDRRTSLTETGMQS